MAARKQPNRKNADVYRRRQAVLIGLIASILITMIIIIVYFVAFNDRKGISQSDSVSFSSSSLNDTKQLEDVTDETNENSADKQNVKFEKDSIEISVDEKITPKILNGSIGDITDWKSSDSAIATVSENGEICGVSVGITAITANVSGTDKLLTLRVDVVSEEDKQNEEDNEDENNNEEDNDQSNRTSFSEPTYIQGILIANKTYGLPSDYNPGEDPEAVSAFYSMQADAAAQGLDIYISSGFRSYDDQDRIYNNYASYDGYEAADRYSARPGHSEHQTGLAFDLNTIDDSFAYTAEGEWVKNNCHNYGFIIRYPEGKEHITGYMYEPWHIRYLGVDTATSVYQSGLTLEEYLGIDSVYAE